MVDFYASIESVRQLPLRALHSPLICRTSRRKLFDGQASERWASQNIGQSNNTADGGHQGKRARRESGITFKDLTSMWSIAYTAKATYIIISQSFLYYRVSFTCAAPDRAPVKLVKVYSGH